MDLVAHRVEQLALLRLERRALCRGLFVFLGLGTGANVRELLLLARGEIEGERVVVAHEEHVLRLAIEMRIRFLRNGTREPPTSAGAQTHDENVAVPFDRAHRVVGGQSLPQPRAGLRCPSAPRVSDSGTAPSSARTRYACSGSRDSVPGGFHEK